MTGRKSVNIESNCKCVADYVVDQDRFNRQAIAAFEEPVDDYQGGFVPMRYVEPPKALILKCEQRCREASDLLERLAGHAVPRETNRPQLVTLQPHQLSVQGT